MISGISNFIGNVKMFTRYLDELLDNPANGNAYEGVVIYNEMISKIRGLRTTYYSFDNTGGLNTSLINLAVHIQEDIYYKYIYSDNINELSETELENLREINNNIKIVVEEVDSVLHFSNLMEQDLTTGRLLINFMADIQPQISETILEAIEKNEQI